VCLNTYISNVRSIVNKRAEFRLFVDTYSPDMICLSETWLMPDIPNSLIISQNVYKCFSETRQIFTWGWCSNFYKKNLPYISVSRVELPAQYDNLEVIAIDVGLVDKSGALPFRMINVYRPPDYTSLENESLFSALTWLADGCARICILGDLNLPEFNWDMFVYPQQHLYCLAADFICTHGLFQLVNEPTRGDKLITFLILYCAMMCYAVIQFPSTHLWLIVIIVWLIYQLVFLFQMRTILEIVITFLTLLGLIGLVFMLC